MTSGNGVVISRRMKKLTWILISLSGVLVLGGGGGWFLTKAWLEKTLTADSIAEQLEKEWNCRAEVKGLSVDLLASPAVVSLEELRLSPRDEEVGKPLSQRKEVTSPGVLIAGGVWTTIRWSDLMRGRLHVEKFTISHLWMREEITPDGRSMMETVFSKPLRPTGTEETPAAMEAVSAAEPAAVPELPKASEPVASEPKASAAKGNETTGGSELPLGLIVDEFSIAKIEGHVLNRQSKTRTALNAQLRLSGIDVDPRDLAHHNRCVVELSGDIDHAARMKVDGETKEVPVGKFAFDGGGTVQPFDVASGGVNPTAVVTMVLKKGSQFGGVTTIGEAAGKDKTFSSIKGNLGIDIDDVKVGGILQNDATAEMRLQNGKVEFVKDLRVEFEDYAVGVRPGSWLNGSADDHEMIIQLVPDEELASKIKTGVASKLGDGLAKTVFSVFADGEGRMVFDFISSDRLSKPKIKLGGQAGAIEQMFKGLGGGLLNQLLKN